MKTTTENSDKREDEKMQIQVEKGNNKMNGDSESKQK